MHALSLQSYHVLTICTILYDGGRRRINLPFAVYTTGPYLLVL